MTKKLWYLLFVLVLATACSSDDDDELIGNWIKSSAFDGDKRFAASCFVIENDAYIGLGYNNINKRLKDFRKYNVETATWEQVADFEGEPRCYASAFATNEKGYICAGSIEDDESVNDLWEYNPTSNSWAQKASLPANPRSEAVGISYNNWGYVGAGKSGIGETNLKDFWKYYPAEDRWEQRAGIKGDKRQGALSFVLGSTIYVCLGKDNGYLTDLQAYNDDTNTWTTKRAMWNATDESFDDDYNMKRAYGVAFVLDGKAYITTGTSGSVRSDTWEYEPWSDRWFQKTSFEGSARYNAVAYTITINGRQRAFVATGNSSSSTLFDDVWEFRPADEQEDSDNY